MSEAAFLPLRGLSRLYLYDSKQLAIVKVLTAPEQDAILYKQQTPQINAGFART